MVESWPRKIVNSWLTAEVILARKLYRFADITEPYVSIS